MERAMVAASGKLIPRAPKSTIEDAYHSISTKNIYATYQSQFLAFCESIDGGIEPLKATPKTVTDFFHYLYDKGRKSSTIDSAKTALAAFFRDNRVEPNPTC